MLFSQNTLWCPLKNAASYLSCDYTTANTTLSANVIFVLYLYNTGFQCVKIKRDNLVQPLAHFGYTERRRLSVEPSTPEDPAEFEQSHVGVVILKKVYVGSLLLTIRCLRFENHLTVWVADI